MKIHLPYPRFVDESREYLQEEITEDRFHSVFLRVIRDLDWYFLVNLPKVDETSSGNCGPIEAAQVIEKAHALLCNKLAESVAKYSASMWLWYRRRLPDFIFAGELHTTLPYNSDMMDVCTGIWGNQRIMRIPILTPNIIYPLQESYIQDVLRVCVYVKMLGAFHVWLRYAGKGVNFQYGEKPLRSLPAPAPTLEQEQAIQLYDKRVEKGSNYIGLGTGTILGEQVQRSEELESLRRQRRPQLMLIYRIREPDWLPSTLRFGADATTQIWNIYATYWPHIVSLAELRDFVERLRNYLMPEWHEHVSLLLLLLINSFYDLHREYNFGNLARVGYFVVRKSGYIEALDEYLLSLLEVVREFTGVAFSPKSADEVVTRLLGMKGGVWPLRRGPPLREEGDRLTIDLYMASVQLNDLLRFSVSGGDAANVRARHFEDMVQEAIDQSSWRPTNSLAECRQKGLRIDQRTITDIDAIGAKGTNLLCVSCKSLDYSPQYDAGSYREVRNAATTVENAVMEWRDKIDYLHRNPVGENYNFASYSNIIGCVCTPHVVYTSLGVATEIIEPNLYAASSISELKDWLSHEGDDNG